MRISDWSSNVCSSDLPCDGVDRDRAHLIELGLVVRADYAIFANRELWKGVTLRRILPSDAIFEHIVLLADAVDEHIDRCRRLRPAAQAGVALTVGRKLDARRQRSEEHTSELQSLMRISYAVFCLKK